MAVHRLYGLFWKRASDGVAMFALHRNGQTSRRLARRNQALCVSMPLPSGGGAWDAPTFRACADRVEYRPPSCLTCGETYPCRGVLQGTHTFIKTGGK